MKCLLVGEEQTGGGVCDVWGDWLTGGMRMVERDEI